MPTPSPSPQILVSVIVPVYNTATTLIETLDSVSDQTLGKDRFEIIIVDDASTDTATQGMVESLMRQDRYNGVDLRVIRHATNQWSAEARNTGVRASRGEFVCTIDSDDKISTDYLLKSVIALQAEPKAGWVNPKLQTFGMYFWKHIPETFNAYRVFRANEYIVGGVVRKSAWLDTGWQRKVDIADNVKWFEDWDFWIRMIARGWFSIPVKDITYWYRKSATSQMDRPAAVFFLSVYAVLRFNLLNIFRARRAKAAWKKANNAHRRQISLFSSLFNAVFVPVVDRVLHLKIKPMTIGEMLRAVLAPRAFIRYSMKHHLFLDQIMAACGFEKNITLPPIPQVIKKEGRTLLMGHYWWHYGGAEKVYVDWMHAIREMDYFDTIVEVALEEGKEVDRDLQERSREFSDRQYVLKDMATHPTSRLRCLWEIARFHQPSVVFNMSNPFLYYLLPTLKASFPNVRTCDLLHNIEINEDGWFGASREYKHSIDRRIVTSEFWRDVLMAKHQEPRERVVVAMNAIELERYQPVTDKHQAKKALGLDPDKFTLTYIGRMADDQKDPFTFCRLIEEMGSDGRFQFLMVGSGSQEKEVQKKIGQRRNVQYAGHRQDLLPYYAATDVLVFPTKIEGYPMVGIETAAMNVPMIGTNVPGISEQIALGNFGFTYDRKDERQDALSIKKLVLEHLDEWPAIGARGRAFVEKHHDFDRQKKVYQEVIRSLVAS